MTVDVEQQETKLAQAGQTALLSLLTNTRTYRRLDKQHEVLEH